MWSHAATVAGWLAVAVLGAAGCAATVEVEGELTEDLTGGAGAGSSHSDGCVSCAEGDCGLCSDPASSLLIFRCPTQHFPEPVAQCAQTGSLFQDPNGSYYVCWRCGPL